MDDLQYLIRRSSTINENNGVRCPQSLRFVLFKGRRDIALRSKAAHDASCIENALAGAVAAARIHGVSGITQQRDTTDRPLRYLWLNKIASEPSRCRTASSNTKCRSPRCMENWGQS